MVYSDVFTIEGPSTILGGLPVWAEFSYTRGDGWSTDDDFEVTAIYWLKRDGTKGKQIPEHIIERAEKQDQYWYVDTFDQVQDNLQPDSDTDIQIVEEVVQLNQMEISND